jgi:heme o synthase
VVGSDLSALSAERARWRDYLTLTKPGINASNLMAVFAGFWLAGQGGADPLLLLTTLLGTALVIAGGCALNNVIDRDIDPYMSRTQKRPVASGKIRPITALWFGIGLTVTGFVILLVLVNPLAAFLAMVGHFVYVGIYTLWLKRTTTFNTVVGGISGAVPPMIGWVAVTGSIDLPAWIIFTFMFLWQPPHFLALAMRKVEDYRAAGVPMLPVVRGFAETKRQNLFYVASMVPASLLLVQTGVVGMLYLVVATVLGLIYIGLSLEGLFTKDDNRWAKRMFFYSLVYLTAMLLVMIIDPMLPF